MSRRRIRIRPCAAAAIVPLLAVSALLCGGCGGGAASNGGEPGIIALRLPQTDGPLVIHVRSDAFDAGEEIPEKYAAGGKNVSPSLSWSGVPDAAKAVVVLVEDPDAAKPKPFVHWIAYNLPGDRTHVPAGVPARAARPSELGGGEQGKNSDGSVGYFGPHPPKGAPPHHYHFQVFALDRKLDRTGDVGRASLLDAMDGHVIAKGQMVATYRER